MGLYKPFLTIAVEHEFFTDNACRHLEFVPTEKTSQLMQKSGLITRQQNNKLHVCYDLDLLDALKQYYSDPLNPLHIRYKVYTQDVHFNNYTLPKVKTDGAILYCSNENVGVSAKSKKSIALREKKFAFDENYPNRDLKSFADNDELIWLNFINNESEYQASDIENMLSNENDDNRTQTYFRSMLAKTDKMFPRPICAIDIKVSDLEEKEYSVFFNSRKTYWKYYLFGEMLENFKDKNLDVLDSKNNRKFEITEEISKNNNRPAIIYKSRDPISLKQQYDVEFKLCKENDHDNPVIKRLPVASEKRIVKDTSGEEWVSEIYINR